MSDRGASTLPDASGELLELGHGEGARLTRRLVRDELLAALDNDFLRPLADGAVLPPVSGPLVLTTDSHVVKPLFFPGGDAGCLAVHGTVNDLAVCGAVPLYLSLGLILEEGLPLDTLRRVIRSLAAAARQCGVCVVTGDTKVVPEGAADGLFLNTTGLGRLRPGVRLGCDRVRPGDRVLISGTIGDHGVAVLAARARLDLEPAVASDTAPVTGLVEALLASGVDVHFLRDPTRGGVSGVLHEVCEGAGVSVVLDEAAVPVSEGVRGACAILGLDPLYVANEGKLMAIVAGDDGQRALEALRQHPLGGRASIIGEVRADRPPQVLLRGSAGGLRALDEPAGALLPRIC
jgi:hydrogenase expression/formation protein HypE